MTTKQRATASALRKKTYKPKSKEQWLWGNKKLGYSIIAGGVHMGKRYKWTLRSWTNGDFWRQFYDNKKVALKRARDAKASYKR